MANIPNANDARSERDNEENSSLGETASRHGMAERLLEIGRDLASRLTQSELDLDIDEMLYDENGLPK